MNIIVLTGGTSSERNVAIASGKAIANALRSSGHSVKVIDPMYGISQPEESIIFSSKEIGKEFPSADELKSFSDKKVFECLSSSLFDNTEFVFLGLHGKFGEDGRLQSMLELRGLKYSGSGVTSSAVAMDKNLSKIIFKEAGIHVADWLMVDKNAKPISLNEKIRKSFGYPVVVKPNDEGSTVGLSIVKPDVEDIQLVNALNEAFKYSESVMVEKFIEGKELTVAVLGDVPLPLVEIKPKDGFYDYEHKYTKGMTEYICPAEINHEIAEEIQHAAMIAHNSLGCKAYSRVDFRMNSENEFFCLEVNTLPGMTELSLVPKAAQAAGIDFKTLLEKIIQLNIN